MAVSFLEGHDLSFAYDGRIVLEGINFSVKEKEKLCVVGENGSGKSTFLKGLLGLKAPAGGRIIRHPGLKQSDIGYLPQESPLQKDFPAAVFEVVLSGRQNQRGLRPFYTRADRAAAAESLELLGLGDLGRRCFRELSGGQRRRVLLARSLCAAGRVLLLDEPASGLDPLVQADLYRVLEKINGELGIAIVMVSHDIEGVLRFTAPGKNGRAGKVLHLAGRQLFEGSAEDYRESELGRGFLGGRRHCGPGT
ncbi:MAG: ATP-binding cassette domain-containing protein [Spirochaetaceae bacterium]|jgi:zinc transport system ATP-binding protein|nr:ATP-binding cassette domain-containing protein [Spirochaetaceae bacterium]